MTYREEKRALEKALAAVFILVILIGFILTLAGCSTINGIGKDISDAATWVADKHNNGWKSEK